MSLANFSVTDNAPVSNAANAANANADVVLELGDEIATLAAHLHAATYRLLTLIADFDRLRGWRPGGHRSCAHWLAYARERAVTALASIWALRARRCEPLGPSRVCPRSAPRWHAESYRSPRCGRSRAWRSPTVRAIYSSWHAPARQPSWRGRYGPGGG